VDQAKNIFCTLWDFLPFLGSLVSEGKNGLNALNPRRRADKLHRRAEFWRFLRPPALMLPWSGIVNLIPLGTHASL
jgi:hypothetical protein